MSAEDVACAWCGRAPAEGCAEVGNKRYCHDGLVEEMDMMLVQRATCWELAQLALASSGPDTLMTDFHERWVSL